MSERYKCSEQILLYPESAKPTADRTHGWNPANSEQGQKHRSLFHGSSDLRTRQTRRQMPGSIFWSVAVGGFGLLYLRAAESSPHPGGRPAPGQQRWQSGKRSLCFCALVPTPWVWVQAALRPHPHLVLSVREAVALLVGVKPDRCVVWICVSRLVGHLHFISMKCRSDLLSVFNWLFVSFVEV